MRNQSANHEKNIRCNLNYTYHVFFTGCNSIEPITESDVINALNDFFSAMDVDNFNRNRVADLVTDDFRIYEMEKNFTLEQFFNFMDSQTNDITSTNWELSNYTDQQMRNQPTFITLTRADF